MLCIGLTGGIASGKSTVQAEFERLGVPVIDADQIAHEVTAPGAPAVAELAALAPDEALVVNGALDRKRLRDRVFKDAVLRQQVEAVLHPKIIAGIREAIGATQADYAVIAIPLLTEVGGAASLVDRVLVVDCPETMQIARLVARDGETEASALRILAAQAGREQRREGADEVLDNSGTMEQLKEATRQLHARYLDLSAP